MLNKAKRILVISPHCDDGELACGGTIARLIEEGAELFHATFSLAEKVGNENTKRKPEFIRAAAALGIPKKNLIFYEYPVRYFSQHASKIRDEMFLLNQKLKPDIVFLPPLNDIHQDHQVITQEAIRIFKYGSILSYETSWNNYKFFPNFFVTLNSNQLGTKIKALKEYKSQAGKTFMKAEFVKGLARFRGLQAGENFAEAFEVIKTKY